MVTCMKVLVEGVSGELGEGEGHQQQCHQPSFSEKLGTQTL